MLPEFQKAHVEAFNLHWETYGRQMWSHVGHTFKAIRSEHKRDSMIDDVGLDIISDTDAFCVSVPRCIFPSVLLDEYGRVKIKNGQYLKHNGANYMIKKVLDSKEIWIRFVLKTTD